MRTFDQWVTARELEKEYRISRRKCWAILHGADGYIRTLKCGNIIFYAWEDCIAFFHDVQPSKARK